MSKEEPWWLTDDHPDAEEHRAFLGIDKKGAAALAAPIPRQGHITQKQLDRCLFEAGKAMAGELRKRDARIQQLEDRPELTFGGPWKDGQSYPEKCLCQHQGGLWLSKTPNNTTRPGGEPPAWRLVVKRGAAG